jgi:uncharacterized membrane protein
VGEVFPRGTPHIYYCLISLLSNMLVVCVEFEEKNTCIDKTNQSQSRNLTKRRTCVFFRIFIIIIIIIGCTTIRSNFKSLVHRRNCTN